MKKLLQLLLVTTITSSTLPILTAASLWKRETKIKNKTDDFLKINDFKTSHKIKRENHPIFLPELIKNTNLGKISTNSEEDILQRVFALNRNARRHNIAIARLLDNQAQIVLREDLENNTFYQNNFIWVSFETQGDVEIRVGNSVFYCSSDQVHLRQRNDSSSLFKNFSTPTSSLFNDHTSINLGIIPDNQLDTIISNIDRYLSNHNRSNFLGNYYLLHYSHSDAIIAPKFSQYEGEIVVTFTPNRIDLNSIIINTDLGTITPQELLPRIYQLNPLLNNLPLFVTFISHTEAIVSTNNNELYFGSVRVLFNFKVVTNNISGQSQNKKFDSPNNSDEQQNFNNTPQPEATALQQIPVSETSLTYNNDNFNGGKKVKNVISVLDENTQGGRLQAGDSYIGTNNGVTLNYVQKGERSHKFTNLNSPIVNIVEDGKGGAFVLNNIGEIYHLDSQELSSSLMQNLKSRDLKKELFLYFNSKKEDVTISFTASNNIKSFDIFTFNLGKINPLNYKYIEFNKVTSQAVTSWGKTKYGYPYEGRDKVKYEYTIPKINHTFNSLLKTENNLLENIITNNNNISGVTPIQEIEKVAANTIQEIDTYYYSAWMGTKQKFGINFYWYKGNYYFQLILFHLLDWRASYASLESKISLGNSIRLYN